ncbi:GlxA family transcriptional regulator [Oleomonas cavernae]|uniref:GlxA family transcriptional regulator n=1 Tax=Oleomonas cavernae TaxID=2320859 RepID=A0A418WG07_9PROT|nr:GlxA family transcriptional regulator [Oleomonas cavernae]RJF88964.1 GlxA family transcriptional regulator [Oleomonas cavernae]
MVDLARLDRIGFLTLPDYSQIAVASAIEACRMANYVAGHESYTWKAVSLDGNPVAASNGFSLAPTMSLEAAGQLNCLFVCGGVRVREAVDRRVTDALRRLARQGVALGSLCTGTFALAEAGLLDNYRCAVHWENLDAVREEFPEIDICDDLFVIDRDRLTCTGGVAPLDLMLALIEQRLGRGVASKVSKQFIQERIRAASERQRPNPWGEYPDKIIGLAHQLMQTTIEVPVTIPYIARAMGISRRQLERVFKRHTGKSPAEYYLDLRLTKARELLRLTNMPITDIGIACGFQSSAHFSTAFKSQYGRPPRAERGASVLAPHERVEMHL